MAEMILSETGPECEDCGDLCRRRTRCRRCKLLVCGWCYNHVHHGWTTCANARTPVQEAGRG